MDFLSFADPEESARQDVDAILATKGFAEGLAVSGHVSDVRTGRVRQVEPPGPSVEPACPA
jgi:hypothetical protein